LACEALLDGKRKKLTRLMARARSLDDKRTLAIKVWRLAQAQTKKARKGVSLDRLNKARRVEEQAREAVVAAEAAIAKAWAAVHRLPRPKPKPFRPHPPAEFNKTLREAIRHFLAHPRAELEPWLKKIEEAAAMLAPSGRAQQGAVELIDGVDDAEGRIRQMRRWTLRLGRRGRFSQTARGFGEVAAVDELRDRHTILIGARHPMASLSPEENP
jgi:hypothetical protein